VSIEETEARLREICCGDNSCSIWRRGGMGTNGGCRCFDRGVFSVDPDQRKAREALMLHRWRGSDLESALTAERKLADELARCLKNGAHPESLNGKAALARHAAARGKS
jgi:hypothetical protein